MGRAVKMAQHILEDGAIQNRAQGTPQGGPLSPLLSPSHP